MRRTTIPIFAIALLTTLAACGGADKPQSAGSDKTKLDCRTIEFIVPYSPGGGSDRQVRRLQPHLQKKLGMRINPTYQTGGDGAVGWQALKSAKPDGCTVGNVVTPNIALLSLTGKDVGFNADEFTYIAWTETTPNALTVSSKSSYKTIEEFVAAAKERPGKLTVAGVGEVGKLLVAQITKATGIKVAYVPVTGGVGDIVPQLQGGHVDAAVIGAAHVAANSNALRGLAITGKQPSPAVPDVPTFEKAGFSGVTLGQSWGVAAPPNTPDDIVKIWNEAINEAMSQGDTEKKLADEGLTLLKQTPAEAVEWLKEQQKSLEAARAANA